MTPERMVALRDRLQQLGYVAAVEYISEKFARLIVDGCYPMGAADAGELIAETERRGEALPIAEHATNYGRGRGGEDERLGWAYNFAAAAAAAQGEP